jgi:hypothetical protein
MTALDQLTPAERADFEERAAIHEFDANLPRPEAERLALQAVLDARQLPMERT